MFLLFPLAVKLENVTWIRIVANQTLRFPENVCVLPAIIMLHVL